MFLSLFLIPNAVLAQRLDQQFDYVNVTGKITNFDGEPIEGARVVAWVIKQGNEVSANSSSATNPMGANLNGLRKVTWDNTAADGSYKLEGVPSPGTYIIGVQRFKEYGKNVRTLVVSKTIGKSYDGQDMALPREGEVVSFKDSGETAPEIPKKLQKPYNKAVKLFERDKYDQALTAAEALVTDNPDFAEGYVLMGNISIKKQDFNSALSYFTQAINAGGSSKSLNDNTAQLAFAQQKFDLALTYAKGALEFDENDTNILYLAGVSAFNLQDWNQADVYLTRFGDNLTDEVDVRNYYMVHGFAKMNKQEFQSAIDLLEAGAAKGMKKDANWYRAVMAAYQNLGKMDKVAELKAEMEGN
jgi:TolA-binding protein